MDPAAVAVRRCLTAKNDPVSDARQLAARLAARRRVAAVYWFPSRRTARIVPDHEPQK